MRGKAIRRLIGLGFIFSLFVTIQHKISFAADSEEGGLTELIKKDSERIIGLLKNGQPEKKAIKRIKCGSVMIAAYAEHLLTSGKKEASLIAIREAALAVSKDVSAKKYANADKIAKTLLNPGKASTASYKAGELVKLSKLDVDTLMSQYVKTVSGGLNMEADIRSASKSAAKVPAQDIALRVKITADLMMTMEPDSGFLGGKKTKAAWVQFCKDMSGAAGEVMTNIPSGGKKLQSAFLKLDGTCTACHNIFKE